jgi:hypothetical protein
MNDLCGPDKTPEEELTPKLKELSLKFNVPPTILRQAIEEERRYGF